MDKNQAETVSRQIEDLLKKNEIHYKIQIVRSPNVRFINLEISIKVINDKNNIGKSN